MGSDSLCSREAEGKADRAKLGGQWQTEKQNWGSRREGRLREGLPVQGRILALSGGTEQSTGLEEGLYQTRTQQAWQACPRLRHWIPGSLSFLICQMGWRMVSMSQVL